MYGFIIPRFKGCSGNEEGLLLLKILYPLTEAAPVIKGSIHEILKLSCDTAFTVTSEGVPILEYGMADTGSDISIPPFMSTDCTL
ncbi:MAG: hypothetical protein BWY84_01044 [Candidatus Aerophobetes bacterium ADurb.Bin490]|nr:MAG: hypothetical protein BWY84_01044 [Candidatus Aerophobetes bacterium ADurb.Bin490]